MLPKDDKSVMITISADNDVTLSIPGDVLKLIHETKEVPENVRAAIVAISLLIDGGKLAELFDEAVEIVKDNWSDVCAKYGLIRKN